MTGKSYDHLQGNPLDADNHPDTVLPDVGPVGKASSPGDFTSDISKRKGISDLSSQMNFYNALGSLYKGN